MLQREDVEHFGSDPTRIPVRKDFAGLKPEVIGLKAVIDADVHILNVNQYKITNKSGMQVGNMKKHFDATRKGLKHYQCQMCHYSTTRAGDLKRHVHAIHKGLKPYQCKLCNYSTAKLGDLKKAC